MVCNILMIVYTTISTAIGSSTFMYVLLLKSKLYVPFDQDIEGPDKYKNLNTDDIVLSYMLIQNTNHC
jgi:hypothetical protein